MKPNFALTLSFDGIGLLHRAFPGWHLVGEVSLDCADLSAELGELRQKAGLLDASGLKTKLVLPNDQIKYLTLNDIPDGAPDIEDQVRTALEGATPYAVDDLAYDWSHHNGTLVIAAVARETLVEAEAFAQDHQFNPVCYVAMPEGSDFAGEPFFGLTQWAQNSADADTDVERDTVPIRVIGASKLPDPQDAAPASDASEPSAEDAEPDEMVDDDTAATDETAEASAPETTTEPAPEPEPEPEMASEPTPEFCFL